MYIFLCIIATLFFIGLAYVFFTLFSDIFKSIRMNIHFSLHIHIRKYILPAVIILLLCFIGYQEWQIKNLTQKVQEIESSTKSFDIQYKVDSLESDVDYLRSRIDDCELDIDYLKYRY